MMSPVSIFLYKLTTQIIIHEILRGRFIIAKYIVFNRGIWSSFESYRQHFYRFANLAFDFIKIIFVKILLTFELFPQKGDSYEICN